MRAPTLLVDDAVNVTAAATFTAKLPLQVKMSSCFPAEAAPIVMVMMLIGGAAPEVAAPVMSTTVFAKPRQLQVAAEVEAEAQIPAVESSVKTNVSPIATGAEGVTVKTIEDGVEPTKRPPGAVGIAEPHASDVVIAVTVAPVNATYAPLLSAPAL